MMRFLQTVSGPSIRPSFPTLSLKGLTAVASDVFISLPVYLFPYG